MKKYKIMNVCAVIFVVLLLAGCHESAEKNVVPGHQKQTIESTAFSEAEINNTDEKDGSINQPLVTKVDWSNYFSGLKGSAVFYNTEKNEYVIYNEELCNTRCSPCSTFKIVSALIGMEKGVIDKDNSVRKWSGNIFWNTEWNCDMDFETAFHTSCVWYFRQVIDELGKSEIQEELDRLNYGNCDISDWYGTGKVNNDNDELTGFWLEASLKISPIEQVKILESIFGENSIYSEETLAMLKKVMQTTDDVYGKTGMAKTGKKVLDAWFVGFVIKENKPVYFCIYLGEGFEKDISSIRAKEIALEIIEKENIL